MAESWRTKLTRHVFNWWPCYRGSGARIAYIAHDWREVRVRIPLSWRTRNYVGTIFGGSMFGGTDPLFMIMLIHGLGDGFTVWDKAASIRFQKPGNATLYATFQIDDAELDAVREALTTDRSVDRVYTVELKNAAGETCATVDRTIYIRRNHRA